MELVASNDAHRSKLETLIGQALKLWPTKTLYPLLEDPFAVVDELQIRGEQVNPPHDSITDFNPPREMDPTLDEDDLYAIGSDLWLLVFQALKSWDTIALYPLLEDEAAIVRCMVVDELRTRGEVDTFNRACSMCSDPREEIREQAAQILSQLGPSEAPAPLRKQSVPFLLELLTRDPSPCVRSAAAAGFGHIAAHEEARRYLLEAAKDPSPEVRFSVAFALGGDHDPVATSALIELMDDSDEDVRDWATFGIGTLRDHDSPPIREALFKRITDSNEEACFEAYAGLAARKDQRILGQLIEELETHPETSRLLESALLMLGRQGEEPEPSVTGVLSELKKLL
jgi:HEAT repeat protein